MNKLEKHMIMNEEDMNILKVAEGTPIEKVFRPIYNEKGHILNKSYLDWARSQPLTHWEERAKEISSRKPNYKAILGNFFLPGIGKIIDTTVMGLTLGSFRYNPFEDFYELPYKY